MALGFKPIRRWIHTMRHAYRRTRDHRWSSAPYVSDASPIIVGGCGRSGTTLMRVILDTHPNICCGPESRGVFRPRKLQGYLADALAWRFDMASEEVRRMLRESGSQAQFVEEFFERHRRAQGKARWADKTPKNVLDIGWIFEHFPKAKFVHVIRDGRDVACSLRNHPRHKVVDGQLIETNINNPIRECIGRWYEDVSAGLKFRGDPRYTEVRYEEMTRQPEATLRRLFEFLEEPWDERVLDFHKVETSSREVTRFPQSGGATERIYTSSLERWRTGLSSKEAAVIKAKAGALLVKLGYAADDRWEPGEPAQSAGGHPAVAVK